MSVVTFIYDILYQNNLLTILEINVAKNNVREIEIQVNLIHFRDVSDFLIYMR